MAGKDDFSESAAGLAGRMTLGLARELCKLADTLVALPAPQDGPAIEKTAKHIKALADAGRSVVALEGVADKAVAARAAARADAQAHASLFDAEDEMDMDDDEFDALDPDVVARRCRDLEARVRGLAGQLERKSAAPRPRTLRQAQLRAEAAGGAERLAGPA